LIKGKAEMSPQLIVPGIVRFAPYGTVNDRPWVNIWDVACGDSPATHASIIAVANAIADTYNANLKAQVANTWNFQGVKYMDLSTPTGEVGLIVDTPAAYSMPFPGTGVGTGGPGNDCALITKATSGGRSQRRGRCYISGMLLSNMSGQNLQPGTVTALQTFATNLLSAVNGAGAATSMVVVHQAAGQEPGATTVTGLTVAQRLASQRRRLRA
jgi:hypothetical protein